MSTQSLDQERASPRIPYKSHPLYRLRRLTLVALLVSAAILFILNSVSYDNDAPIFTLILLSSLFILYDLVSWAVEKLHLKVAALSRAVRHLQRTQQGSNENKASPGEEDDDGDADGQNPEWPRKRVMVGDLVFALIFQYLFWALLTYTLSRGGYYDTPRAMIGGYVALGMLAVSILHGVAWWKELMASRKAKLLRTLGTAPRECARCGHVSSDAGRAKVTMKSPFPSESQPGPSASRNAEAVLPRWVRGEKIATVQVDVERGLPQGMESEDSLLITSTPEEGSSEAAMRNYGTLEDSVQGLKSDGGESVGKKGKRRVVGEDWYGKDRYDGYHHEAEGKCGIKY